MYIGWNAYDLQRVSKKFVVDTSVPTTSVKIGNMSTYQEVLPFSDQLISILDQEANSFWFVSLSILFTLQQEASHQISN